MDESLLDRSSLSTTRLSKVEVEKLLLAAGWPKEQVSKYLEKSFKNVSEGAVVEVRGLGKSFKDHVVLEGVDFDIKKGEIFGIIGMSGSGKTTLLSLMVGFITPTQGDVQVVLQDGSIKSVLSNPELVKSQFGFSTQTPSFYERLTVRENLLHFSILYGLSEADSVRRCNALVDLVGLTDAKDSIAIHLSGGMQKRLDIACALIHDPQILILDEPTADLDPVLRKQMWELIKKINEKGTTIILASHFLAEVELLCSRIAVLQNKKIAELGTASYLRSLYSKNYELILQTSSKKYDSIVRDLKSKKAEKISVDNGELLVETAHPDLILSSIIPHIKKDFEVLHVARPSLGKVFESLVKK